jgi:hypothetical protein
MGIIAQTNPFPYIWTNLPGWAFKRMLRLLDLPILPAVVSRCPAMGPPHCDAGILFLLRVMTGSPWAVGSVGEIIE